MKNEYIEMPESYHARLLINGTWEPGTRTEPVLDKYNGKLIGHVDYASREQVDTAISSASNAFAADALTPYDRYCLLRKTAELIEKQRSLLIRTIVSEAGFPLIDAENEVSRTVQTFLVSAEEGKNLVGQMVPIAAAPGQAHRMAFTVRAARGVVCAIASFNSPLNMVAHKVAPAIASGNTVIVKPSRMTPLTAAHLAEIMMEAGLPPGYLNIVQGPGQELGQWLAEDERIAFYSFTGSTSAGATLRQSIGVRPITLELGSIAATVVCADADIPRAVSKCVRSAFGRAGQSCNSVQRLFVDARVHSEFLQSFSQLTSQLNVGDPHDPDVAVGPLISEADARRAQSWVDEAVGQGAKLVRGNHRSGALLEPTVLTDVDPKMKVMDSEIFAPVVSIIPFEDFGDAIDAINSTPYGLGCGIFTNDIMRAMNATKDIRAGVIHINEPSTSRVDLMPFSGVKKSGIGQEGPRYAIREMTEERLITISLR